MPSRIWLRLALCCLPSAFTACGDDGPVPSGGSTGGSSTGGSTAVDEGTTEAVDTGSTGEFVGCGDGQFVPGEDCDDGNMNDGDGCSSTCELEEGFQCSGSPSDCFEICGDGLVVGEEQCDDDDTDQGDGCSSSCEIEEGYVCEGEPSVCSSVCGDGVVIVEDEECDDGNEDAGDGCSATCTEEDGFDCSQSPSVCTAVCGDGVILGDEECDDFDDDPDDGCSDTCQVEAGWSCGGEPSTCMTGCGDGIVAGMETCDDMGTEDGDGCSADCQAESGWYCMDEPSVCTTDCGDGLVAGDEECDDDEVMSGDGCSDVCLIEPGFACQGEPSVCAPDCGDGVVVAPEECDDGNLAEGDGCGLTCLEEFAFDCVGGPSVCTPTALIDELALGNNGGCLLTSLGEVGCFGNNDQGEVGIGIEDVVIHLPTFTLDTVDDITAGDEHSCALVAGAAWCWGDNSQSQMGPNSMPTTDELLPIEVTGMPPLQAIEAGDDHNCALDMMGGVWCWGDNGQRQLGRGGMDTTDDVNPALVPMPGGLAVTDLGMGNDHSCVVLSDQTVACWGDDDNGQLGDGANGTDSGDATLVVGLTNVVEVEAGGDDTCARTTLDELYCWGDNIDGALGQGNTSDSATPLLVPLPAGVDAMAVGLEFVCALLTDDQVYCWGEGADYQLASGDIVDETSPSPVALPPADYVDIEAGARGACVISAASERFCWGHSESGQLGFAPRHQHQPGAVSFSGPLQELELSVPEYRGVLCGVLTNGTVECAGDSTIVSESTVSGAVGLFEPITTHLAVPTPLPLLSDVQDLGLGDGFACAATSTNVQCWGDNSQRMLGQGGASVTDIPTPSPVVTLGAVDQLEVGDQFACVRIGGQVQCWGDNDNLQTGEGAVTTDQSSPITLMGVADATDLALGENHGCLLRAGGVVSCWGDDFEGQLGDDDGDDTDSAVPVDVVGLPAGVTQIDAGEDHTCALAAGEIYCWGDGGWGQLGQGNGSDSDVALLVPGLSGITQLVVGNNFTCGIDGAGDVTCFGYGRDGQLGNGGEDLNGTQLFPNPVPFEAASGVTDMVGGNGVSCVETGGGWSCLGFLSSGQLGNGTTMEPAVATPMTFGY